MTLLEAALKYAERGWFILPLKPKDKIAVLKEWQNKSFNTSEKIHEWWDKNPNYNIGLNCGMSNLVAIDIDVCDETPDAYEAWKELCQKHNINYDTIHNLTGRGGHHFIYSAPNHKISCSQGALAPGIDVKAQGGYVVIPPSIHPNNKPYLWEESGTNLLDIPPPLVSLLLRDNNKKEEIPETFIEGKREKNLIRLAGQYRNQGMSEEEMYQKLSDDNQKRSIPPVPAKDIRKIANSYAKYPVGSAPLILTVVKPSPKSSDVANAERFKELFGEDVRFENRSMQPGDKGLWYIWNGQKWKADDKQKILLLAYDTVKNLDPRHHSHRSLMDLIAEARPRLAATPDLFDTHPLLLNVANGTIDLTSGLLRPPDKNDFITMQSPVTYDKNATCPEWIKFLGLVTNGASDLKDYLQQAIGYSLTGNTGKQVFFMLYGHKAGNGKSTFLNVIKGILGHDYANLTKIDNLLMKREVGDISDAMMEWRGVRMLLTTEMPPDKKLDEALVKQLAGSDSVSGRRLYGKWHDYAPQLKLWIPGNERPKTSSNQGIMRRAKSIPFDFVFPELGCSRDGVTTKDDFHVELLKEASGILNWAIEGWLSVQKNGFIEPLSVTVSSEQFKNDMDVIGAFIDECCIKDKNYEAEHGELYSLYVEWHKKNQGNRPLSGTSFGIQIRDKGVEKYRKSVYDDCGKETKKTLYQNIGIAEKAWESYLPNERQKGLFDD